MLLGCATSASKPLEQPVIPPSRFVTLKPLAYPPEAVERRLAGRVELAVKIDADGKATDVTLLHSDAEEFIAEAIRSARETDWPFEKREFDVEVVFVPDDFKLVTPIRIHFSEEAKRLGIEGSVRIRITVGPHGKVIRAVALNRLGAGLDEEAMRAVLESQWTQISGEYTFVYTLTFAFD